MFNRRVFLGGAASAAILASSVLTAGTAMADATPELSASPALQLSVGPALQLPGAIAAIQVSTDGSLVTIGGSATGARRRSNLPALPSA